MSGSPGRTMHTPILVVGGGTGGVAAALAVARNGGKCVVTEPSAWVGGQLTSQGVPPDENRWIQGREPSGRGATASYHALRDAVRSHYREHRSLVAAARSDPNLNPGNGWVSQLCVEPIVVHRVLMQMLEPYLASGAITIRHGLEPVSADVEHDRVRSVTFDDNSTIEADYVLDATELGDLWPLVNEEYAVGAEHRDVYGELHGHPDKTDPLDVQAITWCFALEHRAGENHTIAKPARFDFWKSYKPPFDKPWPAGLFSWHLLAAEGTAFKTYRFRPAPLLPDEGEWEMWRYRRIRDGAMFDPPERDVSLINLPQIDYFLKPTVDVSRAARDEAFAEAREQSLCFLYWMQTDAPRLDGTDATGFPGLKLRGDELGTTDGFAMTPYIRESRRLLAKTVVTEAHVGTEQRKLDGRAGMDQPPYGTAEPFPDSVGIGHYRLDLHPSVTMRHGCYAQAAPFRIPLGALLPRRVTNLIAAGKSLGVTHVTNGAYRLHPIEWNIGEAAGALAAWCVRGGLTPSQVHGIPDHLRAFQQSLIAQGVELAWPWEKLEQPDPRVRRAFTTT